MKRVRLVLERIFMVFAALAMFYITVVTIARWLWQ